MASKETDNGRKRPRFQEGNTHRIAYFVVSACEILLDCIIIFSGERILCFHGPLIYDGKCLKIRKTNGVDEYLIHYAGWNKAFVFIGI